MIMKHSLFVWDGIHQPLNLKLILRYHQDFLFFWGGCWNVWPIKMCCDWFPLGVLPDVPTTANFWNTVSSTWNCTELNFRFFWINLYVSDHYQVKKLRDVQLPYMYLIREIESITKTNILKLIRLVYCSHVAALYKFMSLNVFLLTMNVKSNSMIK